jgi:hypothetical protein
MVRARVAVAEAPAVSAARLPTAALALGGALLLVFLWLAWPALAGAAVNTAPPASPVKLIFIHHSTGQAWLDDGHGGLGLGLRDNNYFVSDTNCGWGPASIGDSTDIGNWWTWFRGPSADTYMTALYAENGQHSSYSRMVADLYPTQPNQIVMFKSCFPNSALRGDPAAPIPAISDNALRGQSSGSDAHTVANAKGIYLSLLTYFAQHQEKLFVAVCAPPLSDPTWAANARVFNDWLVDHWLDGYAYHNVFVFDFYSVLTSNGGDADTNDLGKAGGNHHRIWEGAIQHVLGTASDTLAYPTGDDHPSAAGNQKATAEFIPLLNNAYHEWQTYGGGDTVGPKTSAPHSASVRKGRKATLYFRVTDNQCARATVTIRIRTRGGVLKKTLKPGLEGTGSLRHVHFTCKLARGKYRFWVEARDLAGNPAQTPLGHNWLTVK